MDNIHGAHCTTSIVEDPFLVQVNVSAGILLAQFRHDEVDHGTRIIAVSTDGTETQIMKMCRIENVEPLQMRIQEVVDC